MQESLLAAVRVVIPMVLLMALGVLARWKGFADRPSMRQFDRLLFRLFMPALLFKNIYEMDLSQGVDWGEMLFVAGSLLVIFLVGLLVPPRLVKERTKAASIGQALIRSNYILFGLAVAESLYGEGNVGSLALLGSFVVPASNALAAVILEWTLSGRARPLVILLSVLKNPMVVASMIAFGLLALPFRIPALLWGVVRDMAGVATPLSFISLGVGLDLKEARGDRRPLLLGVGLRMVLVPLIFLPLSVMLGYRGPTLCSLLILFASPTAVASYPMAVAMGADGQLAGQLVCATTLLSILSIFLFTFTFLGLGLL